MPGQRCGEIHAALVRHMGDQTCRRVIEDDAEFAFIFAAELAYFQRAGLCRRLPIDVTGGIFRHVFANAIEVAAPAADEAFPFPAHEWKDLEKFGSVVDRRINQNFAWQRELARLGEKREGKARGDAKSGFVVDRKSTR